MRKRSAWKRAETLREQRARKKIRNQCFRCGFNPRNGQCVCHMNVFPHMYTNLKHDPHLRPTACSICISFLFCLNAKAPHDMIRHWSKCEHGMTTRLDAKTVDVLRPTLLQTPRYQHKFDGFAQPKNWNFAKWRGPYRYEVPLLVTSFWDVCQVPLL